MKTLLLILFVGQVCFAQNFFSNWEDRVQTTLSGQPAWAVPLATPSSGLLQVARADFLRQVQPSGTDTWNYGGTKGINLIPWYNVEFDVLAPPYIQHNSKAKDGFGDVSLLLKYRLVASRPGNFSLSASLAGTVPTGSYKNGSPAAALTPTLCVGKGYGNFDVQTAFGASLPTGDVKKLGHAVAWNTVVQYHVGKLWPEIENNATFYSGGVNDGRVQNFLTPGVVVSKVRLGGYSALMFGTGFQIATSEFHTYNHGLILTARMTF